MDQTKSMTPDMSIVYEHDTRPDWGRAILVWERGNKRRYQFEDGKKRLFKQGWYHRLEEVDMPQHRAVEIAGRLQRKLGIEIGRTHAPSNKGIPFDDQLLLFRHQYPDGFADAAWTKQKRGEGCKRRLKRHRDGAIADAQDKLAQERIDAMIAAEQYAEAWNAVLEVLDGTDLITKRQIAPLHKLDDDSVRRLVCLTRDLLWGGAERFKIHFERFVAALSKATRSRTNWQMATVLPALVHPDEHTFIRPTVMRTQASWMAPNLRLSKHPNAPMYMRLRRMMKSVSAELAEAGEAPRDLLDIYDFVWTTLRPKALSQLDEIKTENYTRKEAA